MRCIFTDRTIGIGCFSIGTNRTTGTNGPLAPMETLLITTNTNGVYLWLLDNPPILVSQTSPVGIELFSFVNGFFFVQINLHGFWPREWKHPITIRYFITFLRNIFTKIHVVNFMPRQCQNVGQQVIWLINLLLNITLVTFPASLKG